MPAWVRPTTRWAIYLRDGLRCQACLRTARQLLTETEDEFLTLDHFKSRWVGGGHEAGNLVTSCYSCNRDRGNKILRVWCAERGWHFGTVRSRVLDARRRDVELYREAARRARRQWAAEADRAEWSVLETCTACSRVITSAPQPEEPCPF